MFPGTQHALMGLSVCLSDSYWSVRWLRTLQSDAAGLGGAVRLLETTLSRAPPLNGASTPSLSRRDQVHPRQHLHAA